MLHRSPRAAHLLFLVVAGSWVATASALATGCGSSSSSGDGTTLPESGTLDGAPGADASEVTPDAATAADAADAGPADHIGAVFAISDTVMGAGGMTSSYRAGASFRRITRPDGTTTSKTVGPCLVETIGDGLAEQSTDLSAGGVHIEGGAKTIDLTPKTDLTYAVVSGNTSLWTGGETLTARGDGKDVPVFTTSLKAPPKITLSAPAAPAGALTVTRSAGLSATFTAGASGTVVLYFDQATGSQAFAITCTFDAKAGTAQIPAAAFAVFPAGTGTFNFYTKEASIVRPAGWEVHFTASKAIVDPAGASLTGNATFQ